MARGRHRWSVSVWLAVAAALGSPDGPGSRVSHRWDAGVTGFSQPLEITSPIIVRLCARLRP